VEVLARSPLPAAGASRDDSELAALARRAAARDRQAMRRLIAAVGPAMLRVVRKTLGPRAPDAEDVMQEAAEGFLLALGSFKGECSVPHFACRVAVFTALAWRRRVSFRAGWVVDEPDADAHAASTDPSPIDRVLASRRRAALDMVLDELAPPQAEVLVLHCALDYTIDEIAAAVGRPSETIRSRLRLAKRAVRERIGASTELAELLEMKSCKP
jgi:RNA polymerase sigma-70 factor (ECF subfamily)